MGRFRHVWGMGVSATEQGNEKMRGWNGRASRKGWQGVCLHRRVERIDGGRREEMRYARDGR